jgi:hypothetical protein
MLESLEVSSLRCNVAAQDCIGGVSATSIDSNLQLAIHTGNPTPYENDHDMEELVCADRQINLVSCYANYRLFSLAGEADRHACPPTEAVV